MLSALMLLGWVAPMAALERGTVLVTGASRGIGAACAKRLAKDGYIVAVNYCSNADGAARVVKEIAEDGGSAEAFQADVSTEQAVVDLFNAIDASPLPPLTGLVNNAGIIGFDLPQTLETASTEALTALMNTNVLGPMICCREAAKRMASGSAIVNLSSGSAYLGRPLLYSMSKGALNSMTIGLIEPLAVKGIRLNTVSPGITDTDMVSTITADSARRTKSEADIPMGRFAKPEEIAGTVSYLMSPDASFTHGANIRVAGGRGPGTTLG
jgi:NAD(P)-dependent dehydrogenase (short-subunit alcohol dehydrogenase family)